MASLNLRRNAEFSDGTNFVVNIMSNKCVKTCTVIIYKPKVSRSSYKWRYIFWIAVSSYDEGAIIASRHQEIPFKSIKLPERDQKCLVRPRI